MIGNVYGPGNGTIWLENVDCSGSENALEDCDHSGWGDTTCDHDHDVSITCSNSLTNTIGKLRQRNRATLGKLERAPMPNVMTALPNIGGALCSTPQSLAIAH